MDGNRSYGNLGLRNDAPRRRNVAIEPGADRAQRRMAKIAFEKYFIRKVRKGSSEPGYEKYVMRAMGIARLRDKPAG